jgi:hypothetical protein
MPQKKAIDRAIHHLIAAIVFHQNNLGSNQGEIKSDVKQLTGEVKVIHDVLVAYIADKK